MAEHQLRHGGTIRAAAILPQNIHQKGIGGGLYRKELPVSRVPGKCLFQRPGIFPNPLLVINMKGSGISLCDLFYLCLGYKCFFLHLFSFSYQTVGNPFPIACSLTADAPAFLPDSSDLNKPEPHQTPSCSHSSPPGSYGTPPWRRQSAHRP